MTNYALASIVSLGLLVMGTTALLLGIFMFQNNRDSKSCRHMFLSCVFIFFWNLGYAWMGLCYNSDFAYVPRAIALLAVVLFMVFILEYLRYVSNYPRRKAYVVYAICLLAYMYSWFFIIGKDAVTFVMTPWGYWYKGSFTIYRIVQFGSVILAIAMFYVMLTTWAKRAELKRDKYVISKFKWFGPILFAGYALDTLIPMIFGTAAVPGSALGAFGSAMLLYFISSKYKSYGISVTGVAEYVFSEVNIPVLVLDYDEKITLYNDVATEFFGASDLKGHDILEYVERMENDGKTISHDSVMYSVKGKDTYCRLDRSTVYDDFGQIQCTILFAPDVTAVVNAMKMVESSRDAAEEANQAKSNFLANMSHEIRTPMNAIIGMSDILLRDQKLDDETQSQLENIKEAGNGLLGIINDILDISKIESGKYELIEDNYDTPSLIHDVSTIIKVKLQETPVVLKLEIDPTLPLELNGDLVRIRRILVNILGNATKFTKKGEIKLKVFAKTEGDKATVCFDVSDTGIGIKPEDLDKIFGAFNQVDTRKNRNIQGTGLGLAISKNLAIMMGGDITVESEYGKGSIFHIVIKQKVVDAKPIGEKVVRGLEKLDYRESKVKEKIVYTTKSDKKVLIVDDAKVNLTVAKGLLKPYKLEKVDTASCGAEAVELVKNYDYDLVFMDHMMPELDGVDTMKLIRQLDGDKYKNLTIIALTANAVSGTKEMLIKEGMQDFLAKPINKLELDEIINKWL